MARPHCVKGFSADAVGGKVERLAFQISSKLLVCHISCVSFKPAGLDEGEPACQDGEDVLELEQLWGTG